MSREPPIGEPIRAAFSISCTQNNLSCRRACGSGPVSKTDSRGFDSLRRCCTSPIFGGSTRIIDIYTAEQIFPTFASAAIWCARRERRVRPNRYVRVVRPDPFTVEMGLLEPHLAVIQASSRHRGFDSLLHHVPL
jgi:hypothetical protein